jgi:hypothetical protein
MCSQPDALQEKDLMRPLSTTACRVRQVPKRFNTLHAMEFLKASRNLEISTSDLNVNDRYDVDPAAVSVTYKAAREISYAAIIIILRFVTGRFEAPVHDSRLYRSTGSLHPDPDPD